VDQQIKKTLWLWSVAGLVSDCQGLVLAGKQGLGGVAHQTARATVALVN
jgi:hypothetical protein